jgi:hypothetical protein
MNLQKIFTVLLAFAGLAMLSSCAKDVMRPDPLSGDLLTSGRLDGTWTTPTNMVTPDNVPNEIFGAMRLVFTTDEAGKPFQFMALDCPIIFSSATPGTWQVSGTADSAKVNLTGPGPVDDFDIKVSSELLTLSFFMGWENTETKASGKGNFKVTLSRQ